MIWKKYSRCYTVYLCLGGVRDDGFNKNNPDLYATSTPNNIKSADGTTSGTYGFYELPFWIQQYGLVDYFENEKKEEYYYSPTIGVFFTWDNEESVTTKGKNAKVKGFGGFIASMVFS